ncbi:MAG TPA: transposase [Bacteroidales bacterium]|nr:transposase [Bacteroidales bacterium]
MLGKIDKETAHHYLRDPDVYFYYSLISTRFNHKYIHKLTEKRIETLFSQLCDQFMIRRNYAKSFEGFKTRILAKISSLTPIQFLNKFVFKRPINKIKLNLS